ncbi:hypothetical protein J1N35_004634 [Gossypium stocksii]|uniref:UBC core domain-containing protein n=1 Tax=Gossypium stocksii TaxID=47602 RepID=A0A9D4AHV5_9ROSI|nr:hypothetical protein J1N35_004634 [Gossypium stocksii]
MIDFACVQKELQECSREKDSSGIRVSPKSDNLARLTGIILGPLGTPYEGGSFEIDITLPGIPGDRRCMFRSVAHRACLRSGKSAPSEQAQRELADDLRAKDLVGYQVGKDIKLVALGIKLEKASNWYRVGKGIKLVA